MRVKWLRIAVQNLDQAAEWIAKDNPQSARVFVISVQDTVDKISHFPAMGKTGRVAGVREMGVVGYPYIIPYRVVGDELQILRIFHVRQQRPDGWE